MVLYVNDPTGKGNNTIFGILRWWDDKGVLSIPIFSDALDTKWQTFGFKSYGSSTINSQKAWNHVVQNEAEDELLQSDDCDSEWEEERNEYK